MSSSEKKISPNAPSHLERACKLRSGIQETAAHVSPCTVRHDVHMQQAHYITFTNRILEGFAANVMPEPARRSESYPMAFVWAAVQIRDLD